LTAPARFGMEVAAMPSTHLRASRVVLHVMLTSGIGCAGAAPMRPVAVAGGTVRASASPIRDCPAGALRAVVARSNAARRRVHLDALVADPHLASAARTRAGTMAAENRLSHAGWEQLVRIDAGGGSVGENIAYNYPTAQAVMRSWLASPGHRANILQASFHRIGVGCIVDATGKRWWTEDFAD
jgi:uncharacterized protein YkwD